MLSSYVERLISFELVTQIVQNLLEIAGQRTLEFHASSVDGVSEGQFRRVKERTLQVSDGTKIARHSSMDTAVQRIADNRMADGVQMNAYLMRSARVNSHADERQRPTEMFGPDDTRDGFAAAAGSCGHFLSIDRISPNRRIDAAARHDLAPDERNVLLLHLPILKLLRE